MLSAGAAAEQEIRNSVARYELETQTINMSRQAEMDAWLTNMQAESVLGR